MIVNINGNKFFKELKEEVKKEHIKEEELKHSLFEEEDIKPSPPKFQSKDEIMEKKLRKKERKYYGSSTKQ